MLTPALLFKSLRISSPTLPVPTLSVSLPAFVPQARFYAFKAPSSSSSSTLPPPSPFFTSRSKLSRRSRLPPPSALEFSAATASTSLEFAHLLPVERAVETDEQRRNLELAERFPERTVREEMAEGEEDEGEDVDPTHLYTAPPPLTSDTAISPESTAHFRTFLAHHKNLLAIHIPLQVSTRTWSRQTNPKQKSALRNARWEAQNTFWDDLAAGKVETLSFSEAKEDAVRARRGGLKAERLRNMAKMGDRQKWIDQEKHDKEIEEKLRRMAQRRELRKERLGVIREGFAKGGVERVFLERYLGDKMKPEEDGRGRQPKIGRNARQ